MSFNVQAALYFPLGEPLSVFSGRHSMTCPLFLNLLCHGRADGRYMARKSSSRVVGTLDLEPGNWGPEPGSWDPEPGSWNPEPRGGRAAVFPALGQGSFRGTTQSNLRSTLRRCIPLVIRLTRVPLPLRFLNLKRKVVLQLPLRGCLSGSLNPKVAGAWFAVETLTSRTRDCRSVIPYWDLELAGTRRLFMR
ncbi:hypothetical protein DY000_02021834 [Brassica cretica]|uniref:Uncharacterized protein n=1 Tax=Brassica cretica TaxID=69181 RepID=A0ABQ7DZT0_BRACR|nr:hypothetical protein DY000_02021834 [Brassica cretica]